MSKLNLSRIAELLGGEADSLLKHECRTVSKDLLHLPGPDFVERIWFPSDRNPRALRSLQALFDHGRLGGTGYLSILPVDQGIEHSAGASFAKNPIYFDPENIVKLAIEGGCNAVVTTFGVLGAVARKYAHRIPLILKFNHNELLTVPNESDEILFARVRMPGTRMRRRRGDDLLRPSVVEATDSGGLARLLPGPRTRHGDHPLVLSPQQRLQGRQDEP